MGAIMITGILIGVISGAKLQSVIIVIFYLTVCVPAMLFVGDAWYKFDKKRAKTKRQKQEIFKSHVHDDEYATRVCIIVFIIFTPVAVIF